MSDPNIEAIYRLSPLQEGILFHTLEAPGSYVYFQQYSCLLEKLEDADKWQQAWNLVVQDHAILRTLFTWEKRDHPLQIVRERVSAPWQMLDWLSKSQDEQRLEWEVLQAQDRGIGFELSTAPLMRFTLARVSDSSYRFLWSFHHILLDGWSQRLIFNQVLDVYRTDDLSHVVSDQKAPQYGDFIHWLGSVDLDAARLFWTDQLRGFTKPTYIAGRVDVGASTSSCPPRQVRELALDPELIEQLSRMARENHMTLNTLVVGAWGLVLAAHNRSEDVVFGSTVSGRPVDLSGAERIAGLMINTLPLRMQISAETPLVDWLGQLQSTQLGMREYEQTPLVEIKKCSGLPPGSALFDSIVVFENIPGGVSESAIRLSPAVTEQGYSEYSHYPLALLVDPGDQMKLIAVYQTDHIADEKARRLLQQLATTLDSMSRSPLSAVGDIHVLPNSELRCLTHEWNQTEAEFPTDLCIHELFEQNAAGKPKTSALICGEEALSFAEVNAAANQLAHYLLEKGVGAGSLVPVFMERGNGAIIALLAVMKTGAAYIPVDSGLPADRITQILDDIPGERPVIITQNKLLDSLPDANCELISAELIEHEISALPVTNLDLHVSPEDLAYVIYTSGSSGLPKGVMVQHMSLVNSTWARLHYYPSQPGVFLLLSSLAVDSSVAGLYWCLCGGATLLVATPRLELDVQRVGQLIADNSVSHLLCIASLYQIILEYNPPESLRSLKSVIVAGEACAGGVIAAHQAALPDTHIYNEYGPSECTVWSTAADLSHWRFGQPVPIGRPIANTSLYILDGRQRSVPLGAAGELYIGGVGLAQGYLNRPEATEAAFHEVGTLRLYKTGDLVRFREDGNVEFLGRVDNQVKVRGYRVEPEEIERVLAAHPLVGEVVVFADHDQSDSDENRLILRELALMDEKMVDSLLTQAEKLGAESKLWKGEI